MTQENNHTRRFAEIPAAVLEDLKGLLQQPNQSQKQWLKSSLLEISINEIIHLIAKFIMG